MPAENPTKDIVQEENTDTGTVGAAPGAEEIIAELENLNKVADSIGDGSTENIGDSGSGDGPGEAQTPSDDTVPATEDEDTVPEEIEEKTDEGEKTETSEVNEVSEGGDSSTTGDYKEPDTPPKDPQPVQDIQTDVSASSNASDDTGSGATVGEAGDTTPLDSDIDLHGSEFEKAATEFDNIIKTDDIGDSTVGETFTEKSDLITGGLQEMAAHAESVRAELKKAGAMLGFEAAMMGVNVGGMESATNTNDTFDNSGDLFKDIFKGL